MATSTTSYKNKRSARIAQLQVNAQLGCHYTNQEVPAGYAKLLVNYDYTDDGKILKPRMGITNDAVLEHSPVDLESTEYITLGDAHLDGLLYFKDLSNNDQLAETVLSFGQVYAYGNNAAGIKQGFYFNPNIDNRQGSALARGESGWSLLLDKRDSNRFAQKPYYVGHFKKGNTVDSIGFIRTKNFNNINLFNTGLNNLQINKPVACTFNGGLYTICTSHVSQDGDTITCADPKFKLSRLIIQEENNGETNEFNVKREVVELKKPLLSEAMTTGFNMLLDDPYKFNNSEGATDVFGIIPYRPGAGDTLGDILFTANVGEQIRFNCVYSFISGRAYKVKWSYKGEGEENWTVIKDWTSVTVGTNSLIYIDYVPTHNTFSLQVELREGDDNATVRIGSLPGYKLNQDHLKNLGTDKLDLTTATGMFTFNNMLGLYGVEGAETTLFFSDIENPGYFPFPHNTESYDEYILKVINYLDILLVVTTTSIYTISGSGLASSFVSKKLITNLNITESDAELIKVIKDQVFFKADNTFFVLKPNSYTGDAADLRAYEVSKSINTFLQNFKENTLALFNTLYPLKLTEPNLINNKKEINIWKYNDLSIKGYNQHVVDGKLQVVLRLELVCNETPNYLLQRRYTNDVDLVLIYDTLTKQWYFQTFNLLNTCAIRHRRIDNQVLLLFDNFIKDNKKYLLIAKHTTDPRDYYEYDVEGQTVKREAKLPNWQLLDTGVLELNNVLYKRLRELQFTINNTTQQQLKFFVTMNADGKNVLEDTKYVVEQDTAVDSLDYGHIYVNAYEEANLEFISSTVFDDWTLDFSKFPDITLLRTHLLLTGKGRFISCEVINRDEKPYELSNTILVYRVMHSR